MARQLRPPLSRPRAPPRGACYGRTHRRAPQAGRSPAPVRGGTIDRHRFAASRRPSTASSPIRGGRRRRDPPHPRLARPPQSRHRRRTSRGSRKMGRVGRRPRAHVHAARRRDLLRRRPVHVRRRRLQLPARSTTRRSTARSRPACMVQGKPLQVSRAGSANGHCHAAGSVRARRWRCSTTCRSIRSISSRRRSTRTRSATPGV